MGQRVTFDDGKYVDFDGDDPISDEDIAWAEQQVYGNTKPTPKTSRADRIGNFGSDSLGVKLKILDTPTPVKLGDLEAGVNMLSGFPGMAVGGLAGLGSFIGSGGDIDQASQTLESVTGAINDKIQYEPRSARGKEATEAFGWANKQLSEASGEIVSDMTGGSNAGQLVGSLGYDVLSNLIPLSPAMKGKPKPTPKPTEVNTSAVRAQEILAQKKAQAEAPKPVVEAPKPDTLPDLLPEMKDEAATYPPLLPETPVEASMPFLPEQAAPTLPKRGRKPTDPETPLPEVDPHLLGERAVDGLEVTPLPEITGPKGPRNARTMDNSDVRPAEMSWFKVADDGVVDVRKTMESLSESPKSFVFPGYKDLTTKLLSHLDDTGLSVRVVDYQGVDGGLYMHRPHEILLKRGAGDNNYVLMHEMVHAATGRWMQDNLSHPLVKQLDGLRQSFIKQFGDTAYGAKDVHEFVAEANANPKFQAFLKQTPEARTKFQKIKDKFVQIVRSMLGLTPKETNALARALSLSDQVMQKQRPEALAIKALKDQGISAPVIRDFASAMAGRSKPVDLDSSSVGKIQDYINKVRKSKDTTSPLFEQEKKIAAISKIPGMEMGAYIPKDVPWGDVKLDLRSLPDIPDSSAWDMFVGSKEMAASLKRNPAMYAIGQWFTNARKRAELYDQVALKPLEKDIMKSVRKGEAASVMAVMKEESYAKMRLTPEELSEVLSPAQVVVYNKLRAEFDAALAIQNKALNENGHKSITPHEAYISSRWGGQWRTKVVDKEGNVVWWIAEKTKAKAQHALEYLKANHPDLDYAKSKVEYKNKSMGSEGKETLQGYREMLKVLDEDAPLTKKLQELYEKKLEQEGYRSHGHDKHFEPKGGTKGFHGERPWVNTEADVKAFFESQLSYLRESHLWAEQQTAVSNTKKMLYDKELQDSHKNTLDWVRETARNEIGSDTAQWVRSLEHKLFKTLGLDPSVANHGISTAKGYFYSTKLGFFNAPFALMSVVQPVFTIPHHMRLTERGFDHNPAKTMFDSLTMTAATILPKLAGDASLGMVKGKPVQAIPQLYKDAFKYMEANGIVNLNQYSDVGHITRSPAMSRAMDVMNYSITAPEKIARTTAFMGYVSHLNQSGKFKGDDVGLFQKAEELTNLSMANFKHTERAPAFNKAGMAGNALVTLQTFKINQLNQLRDFWKGGSLGESRKPFYAMLATQITMAGMMGLYGVEQAEWMWKWLKKGMNEAGIYDEDLMEFSPKKWMLENMDSLMSMGVMSQIMGGKDYHSRMDQGTILDPTFAGMMPFVSDIVEQGKDVLTFAADPTSEKFDRALYSVTPSSLKGVVEMGRVYDNTLTGKPGQGDAFSADRPDEPLYKRTQADKDARGTILHGVPTLTEAREKTGAFKRRETEQLRTRQLAIQTEKFHAASRQQDTEDMAKAIRKVATLGGDWEALIDGQVAQLEKRATTSDEKALLKASDPAATIQTLLKIKRQLEATRKLRENH